MKMFLDTSTPVTLLKLDDKEYYWESGRDLAENLHAFLRDKLAENGATFSDISEISFMSGPGSFTGLRIGAAGGEAPGRDEPVVVAGLSYLYALT